MNSKDEFDKEVIEKLRILQTSYKRDPEKAQNGRAQFLQEAEALKPPVSKSVKSRHNNWITSLKSKFVIQKKEHQPMFTTLSAILTVIALVLSGGGITAVSAQSSLPDEAFYGIKLWTEDIRLDLTSDPESQYQVALDFMNRRADEIKTMLEEGAVPSEAVIERYQNHVEQAVRLASGLPGEQADHAMEQIRECLQTQSQTMLQLQTKLSPQAQGALTQTQLMLQDRLRLMEKTSETDQTQDQIQLQQQTQDQIQLRTSMPEEQATRVETGAGGFSPAGEPTQANGNGSGAGPLPSGTCTPGSSENGGQQITQPTPAGQQPTNQGGSGGKH